ncbi:MAG: ring-cleaving dioxygenase [Balneolaceae bacterium]|nr:ring-cleaving dioxygenase [Balneolaceae bacterium]
MIHKNGIHHITAVAGDPQKNLDFYAGILGLRLVKKTVNFDDPSVYHLYYGDETGRPGTILTFFPWSHVQQGHPDRGQAIAIAFSIPPASVSFWTDYLGEQGVDYIEPFTRFGKEVIGIQDPDGLHLELVADPVAGDTKGWNGGPLPGDRAIRGIHSLTLAEENFRPTGELLTEVLGFKEVAQEHDRILYETDNRLGAAVEIIDNPELDGRPGKGTVHHVAFRTEDDEKQMTMRKELLERGYHVTEVKDRQYFRSIYFHEPGGILFELATEGPGFATDEAVERLGESLMLPSWLEDRRDLIEADLPKLTLANG